MEWRITEAATSLKRGWPLLLVSGAISIGGAILVAYSPLADLLKDYGVHPPLAAKVIAGIVIGSLLFGLSAIAGAGFGGHHRRRLSLRYVVDDTGSCNVIAEYRGLRDRELPLRLGTPPTTDPTVYIEPLVVTASHGFRVKLFAGTTEVTSLPAKIVGTWEGRAEFDGLHKEPFDCVVVYRMHCNACFTLADHQAKWGDDFDEVDIDAKTDWDEVEVAVIWTGRIPDIVGEPEVHRIGKVDPESGKPKTSRQRFGSRDGVWSASVRHVRRGERIQLRWTFRRTSNSGNPPPVRVVQA